MDLYKEFGLPKHLEIEIYRDIPKDVVDNTVKQTIELFHRYDVNENLKYLIDDYITLELLWWYKNIAVSYCNKKFSDNNVDILTITYEANRRLDNLYDMIKQLSLTHIDFIVG